jgi:hypothetical protein
VSAAPLPVRPQPRTGETLTSYAVRLADANGLTRSTVLPRHRRDVGVPPEDLANLAALGHLAAADAALLTMDRYPPTVRGTGPTHRGGWRLHYATSWSCAGCTATTGYTELLWQTALMPVCRDCGLLLVRGRPAHGPTVASREVLDIVTRLVDLAEDAVTKHAARSRLGRFRRLCASIAQTVDETWPARPEDLPVVDRNAARQWGAFPTPDPATVATLLVAASPGLRSNREYDRLAHEALLRRRGQPLTHPAKYLPKRPPAPAHRPPILAGFTATDGERLRWLLARLTRLTRRNGLAPQHVPAMLPSPGEAGPLSDPSQWRTAHMGAIALHLVLSTVHDEPASTSHTCTQFGEVDDDTSPLLDGLRLGRGVGQVDADLLLAAARQVVQSGLVDYQRRRDTLRPVTHLPTLTVPDSRLPGIDGIPGRTLALGWIWTEFTHGPMWTSGMPLLPTRAVLAFDERIDPETRLTLYETGMRLLAAADLIHVDAANALTPIVTGRYG